MSAVQQEPLLRLYRPSDFDAIFRLDELCFEVPFRFSRAALRRFAETRRAHVLVAELQGRVVAFCIAHLEQSARGCVGYVVTLDVDPAARRRGLARRLLSACEEQMRQQHCQTMLLHVFTGNADAIRFYESLGYVRVHTVDAFYAKGLDAFVYRKRLA